MAASITPSLPITTLGFIMRIYNSQQVHQYLPWERLLLALQQAFSETDQHYQRYVHSLDHQDSLLLMPAWSKRYIGTKIVTVMPNNVRQSIATVQANYVLQSRQSGELLALLDGAALTLRRTSATSVLAAKYLAREAAENLLIVGAGELAPFMAYAYQCVFKNLKNIFIWARNIERGQKLARQLQQNALPASYVAVLKDVVRQSDIVSCVTTSHQALVQGAWMKPGSHLDLVGAFRADMREADDQAVLQAQVFIDTASALSSSGELAQPLQNGVIQPHHIQADLAELVKGLHPGRQNTDVYTLFKSVGCAIEDLAAAALIYEQNTQPISMV